MDTSIIKNILTESNQILHINDSKLNNLINEHSIWGQINSEDKKVKSLQKRNLVSNMIFQQEFLIFSQLLKKNNIPVPVPLKGLSLLKRVYSKGSERKLTDIDLYIDQKYIDQIHDLLLKNEYFFIDEKKWHANQHKRLYGKSNNLMNITFEIHYQLYYHTNYQPQLIIEKDVTLLSYDDELIYLCYHLAEQHNFIKLFWLNDIKKYINSYERIIDWTKTYTLAQNIGVERSLNLCLFLCSSYLQSKVICRNKIPYWLKKILTWKFLCYPRKSIFKYHLLKFYLKKNRAKSYYMGWLVQRLKATVS